MSIFHVVYKLDGEVDFYSKGENFSTDQQTEHHKMLHVLGQWNDKYPQDQYPNIKLMAIYPVN